MNPEQVEEITRQVFDGAKTIYSTHPITGEVTEFQYRLTEAELYSGIRAVIAEIQKQQEPAAHMYPSDLDAFSKSECFATAFSVAVGCPDEESIPLFTFPPDEQKIMEAIKAIRKSDCGAWLKDCRSGLFRCSDGSEKRYELSRLLDALYKTSGV